MSFWLVTGAFPRVARRRFVTKLKRLEAQRRAAKQPPSAEEIELDTKIRQMAEDAGNGSLSIRA